MTKFSKIILSSAAMAIIGGGAYLFLFSPESQATPTTYKTATVTTGSIQSIVTAQGTLEPKDYVDVGAQISGKIIKLAVDIGDDVKSGDLIAEIDPKTYESIIAADEADLAKLKAQKQESNATLAQAKRDMTRNKNLVAEKAISQSVYNQSATDYKVAAAQLAALNAQIIGQESTLDKDKTNLTYTKIYAPFDGTVVDLSVKEGETVNANQTTPTIGRVANLDVMTAKAQVAEADISKLKSGMKVYFTTLGSDGRKWEGTVRQILPTPETVNDVVLYNILVDANNADRALMTGMTTQMFFEKGSAKDVMTIPTAALLRRDTTQDTDTGIAYIVKVSAGKNLDPIEKTIIVGLSDRNVTQVISGLNLNDTVVMPATSTSGLKQETPRKMPGGL